MLLSRQSWFLRQRLFASERLTLRLLVATDYCAWFVWRLQTSQLCVFVHHRHPVTHAIFNLPAAGVELLDCFRGLNYVKFGLPRPLEAFLNSRVLGHGPLYNIVQTDTVYIWSNCHNISCSPGTRFSIF